MNEEPSLAKAKFNMIADLNRYLIEQKKQEDVILQKLTETEGDILENQQLVGFLASSEKTFQAIKKEVEKSKIIELKYKQKSEGYMTVASRAALMFFIMKDLNKIHPFYTYSFDQFLGIIDEAFRSLGNVRAIDTHQNLTHRSNNPISMSHIDSQRDPSSRSSNRVDTMRNFIKLPNEEIFEKNAAKEEKMLTHESEKHEHSTNKNGIAWRENETSFNKVVIKVRNLLRFRATRHLFAKSTDKLLNMLNTLDRKEDHSRVPNLINAITTFCFNYINQGLFQNHKLIVAVILALRIELEAKNLNAKQIEAFFEDHSQCDNPMPQNKFNHLYFKDETCIPVWNTFNHLDNKKLVGNGLLMNSLKNNDEAKKWFEWYENSDREHEENLPDMIKKLPDFEKIILFKALRPDCVPLAMENFVRSSLGEKYLVQNPFNSQIMEKIIMNSNPTTPILFVLKPGIDPLHEVEFIARKYKLEFEIENISQGISEDNQSKKKFIQISLGQSQEEKARKAILDSAKDGSWVMLQNIHLMPSWLKSLEGYLQVVASKVETHSEFRCFLTSEPPNSVTDNIIPEYILKNSIKLINEAPKGFRDNFERLQSKLVQEDIQNVARSQEYKKMLFGLCLFHSLLLGRKKFGAEGWSQKYNFRDIDLSICTNILKKSMERLQSNDKAPLQDLRFIFGEIIYGGHMRDDWDRRVCNEYLKVLFKKFEIQKGYPEYVKYLKQQSELPVFYGLNQNVEIGYFSNLNSMLFDNILKLQKKYSTAEQENDDLIKKEDKDEDKDKGYKVYLDELPKHIEMKDVLQKLRKQEISKNHENENNYEYARVLAHECERMNTLLFVIKESLENCKLAEEVNLFDFI